MTTFDNRYVAHFDVLGMSNLTLKHPETAWDALSRLVMATKERLTIAFELEGERLNIIEKIATFTFSDTIVAFTKFDTKEDLHSIIIFGIELFARAMFYGVPLRGGIAHGIFNFNFDYNLFSGPALVNAYLLGECAQWLGIVVDESVADRACEFNLRAGGSNVVVQWDVPQRDGKILSLKVLNWPAVHRENFLIKPPMQPEAFYEGFKGLFGPISTLPPDVQAKYRNTTEFINHCLT